MPTWKTSSSSETKKLIPQALEPLFEKPRKKGVVLALSGELGSGKTTFTQGLYKFLGAKGGALSPTFVIMRSESVKKFGFKKIFHLDCYRLDDSRELAALGFKELLASPEHLIVVEWAERVKKILPKDTKWIRFYHEKKENKRRIVFR